MAKYPESTPMQPTDVVREKMHAENNDYDRDYDYRGVTGTIPEGDPTFSKVKYFKFGSANPQARSRDERLAMQSPNPHIELANLQNRHDEDELVATSERIEELGNPGLSLKRRRELAKLADRRAVIDPTGDMAEQHRQFRDANLDTLTENARADAARDGVVINTGEMTDDEVEAARAKFNRASTATTEADSTHEDHEKMVTSLANVFHEVWLRTRNKRSESGAIYADGSREAREKSTKDKAWSETHGKDTVDIAHTGYVDLPEDWRAENTAAAEVIVTLIQEMGGAENIDLSDPKIYAKVGTVIHERWLERNTYAKGGDLDIPFTELPEAEQKKDLEQLIIALELFKPEAPGVLPRPFETRALHTVNNWALGRGLPMRGVDGKLINTNSDYYLDQYDALMAGRR